MVTTVTGPRKTRSLQHGRKTGEGQPLRLLVLVKCKRILPKSIEMKVKNAEEEQVPSAPDLLMNM